MIELKPPNKLIKIFTAGSIEMGKAEHWQDRLARSLAKFDVVIFNPRREDWDSSWNQDPTPGTKFYEQVNWELSHIDDADIVVFYFDPNTQSPITLLELGYCIGINKNMVVCCPDGFFRKGNVVITCAKRGVTVLNSFEEFIANVGLKIETALA